MHQQSVKMTGNQTQRRPSSFTVQCGQRDGERAVIDNAFKYVRHMCPPDDRHLYNQCSTDAAKRTGRVLPGNYDTIGTYTAVSPMPTNGHSLMEFKISWTNKTRTVAGIQLHNELIHCLTTHAIKHFDQIFNFSNLSKTSFLDPRCLWSVSSTS